jgi:hypothetical protein
LATHHRSGRGAADNAETINQSATFAERATEIAHSLNLVNQLAGETVRLIEELQRDYTSTGQPWAAFVAEQFPTWGGGRFARTMLIEARPRRRALSHSMWHGWPTQSCRRRSGRNSMSSGGKRTSPRSCLRGRRAAGAVAAALRLNGDRALCYRARRSWDAT